MRVKECSNMYAISGAFNRVLTGTATRPARNTARSNCTVSMELDQWTATRSPGRSPRSRKWRAKQVTEASSSPYVIPRSVVKTAALLGCRSAWRRKALSTVMGLF